MLTDNTVIVGGPEDGIQTMRRLASLTSFLSLLGRVGCRSICDFDNEIARVKTILNQVDIAFISYQFLALILHMVGYQERPIWTHPHGEYYRLIRAMEVPTAAYLSSVSPPTMIEYWGDRWRYGMSRYGRQGNEEVVNIPITFLKNSPVLPVYYRIDIPDILHL